MSQPSDSLDPEGYYRRLGLEPGAPAAAIAKAYRAKARLLHPDVPVTGNAPAFVAVKQAYDILSNQQRRDAYDLSARRAAVATAPPQVFTASPVYDVPVPPARPPRFSDLPAAVWVGMGAFLVFCVVQAVLHLREERPVVRSGVTANAMTVAPLSPTAHQEVLYGPAPARLPGTPNFYVVPAASPAVLWRLDKERNTFLPAGHLPLFSSVQVLRLIRQTGMLEILTEGQTTGFVQASHLAPGDYPAAQRAYCSYNAGMVPVDGEVLQRGATGSERLEIDNRAVQPAVVKLRDASGTVALAVFLAPGGHADVKGLPKGGYLVDYAIGELWSRACGIFAAGMRAVRLNGALVVPRGASLVVATDGGSDSTEIPDNVFAEK